MNLQNGIFKSVFVTVISGRAIDVFLPPTFNIESIGIKSKTFESDIEAINASKVLLDSISSDVETNKKIESKVDLNPLFFPNVEKAETNKIEPSAITVVAYGNTQEPITNNFDPDGDFISMRIEVGNEDFNILTKIITDPMEFVKFQNQQMMDKQDMLYKKSEDSAQFIQ